MSNESRVLDTECGFKITFMPSDHVTLGDAVMLCHKDEIEYITSIINSHKNFKFPCAHPFNKVISTGPYHTCTVCGNSIKP